MSNIVLADNSASMKLNTPAPQKESNTRYTTHSGHKLNIREERFITEYLKTGDHSKAYKLAGYRGKNASEQGRKLLKKPYIMDEVSYRTKLIADDGVADASEVMKYFTAVMRGEVADQFGLDAPLSERTSAAREIKKHYDLITKEENKKNAEITVTLDWERPEVD